MFGGIVWINYSIAHMDKTNMSAATNALVSILPIIYAFEGVIVIIHIFTTTKEIIRYKRWDDFGNRLKLAYTAKFGGENKEFNEEVNNRILQCKTMKVGIGSNTKGSAERWLKEYAHMVEIPFVIPEEEHLSEEDKTKEFGDNNDKEE